jgi:hypothetical protein
MADAPLPQRISLSSHRWFHSAASSFPTATTANPGAELVWNLFVVPQLNAATRTAAQAPPPPLPAKKTGTKRSPSAIAATAAGQKKRKVAALKKTKVPQFQPLHPPPPQGSFAPESYAPDLPKE